ncbi:MAG TPA: YbhB/YbcL family Raf kinase inhibitor-like protein [Dyella sp.]|uniref:YbhB/YbcL family Raf kinase inhibitor-like protein n=1 Tax=Dyella sp. TaxID=1869338 RepID=UPI002C4F3509|nr:YbhB/YbcL family Raf kinase inhibitor-like protein [Dyella sp.]HUB91432.1 YbhB/YbcL family Raf kinase inhibitor-like protein [Dyella sp.]
MLRTLAIVFALSAAVAHAGDFSLQVDATDASGNIAQKYMLNGFGCTGKNLAPALHWQGPPSGTRSFALTVYDPDAPTGSGWWHWVVINLPASARMLPEGGVLPAGAQGVHNDFGTITWGGPCPPVGDRPHHYVFTVYALDVPQLDVPANATAALAGFMLHGHVLGKAQQTLLYGR